MKTLPKFDDLLKMSDEELEALLRHEAKRFIDSQPEEKRSRLRAIHNGARMRTLAASDRREAMIDTFRLMYDKFKELRELLDKL